MLGRLVVVLKELLVNLKQVKRRKDVPRCLLLTSQGDGNTQHNFQVQGKAGTGPDSAKLALFFCKSVCLERSDMCEVCRVGEEGNVVPCLGLWKKAPMGQGHISS